jgi:sensory rhodopsin
MDPLTVVYALGTLGMLFGLPPALRLVGMETECNFKYLLLIPGFAALMYLFMGLGIGTTTFQGYQVPLARYADWLVTTPVLVGYTAYVAGMSRKAILGVVLADALMIVIGAAAVVLSSTAQWVAFGLSGACHLTLLFALYGPILTSAWNQPPARRRLGRLLVNHVGLLWLVYPVVWVFGPGLQLVSTTAVAIMIAYADVVAKVPYVYFLYRARGVFAKETASPTRTPEAGQAAPTGSPQPASVAGRT